MSASLLDTSGVLSRVATYRREALAQGWSLDAARSLLLCGEPTDDDIRLCCESMLLDMIIAKRPSERVMGQTLGVLASVLAEPDRLDAVLCHQVGWLRLFELSWLCDNERMTSILLKTALCGHPLAEAFAQTTDFSGPLAHVRVAWYWDVVPAKGRKRRYRVAFDHPPLSRTGVPMNSTLRKALFPHVE